MSPSAQAFPFPEKVGSIEKRELARGLRGSWCQISGKSPLARLKSSRGRRNVTCAVNNGALLAHQSPRQNAYDCGIQRFYPLRTLHSETEEFLEELRRSMWA